MAVQDFYLKIDGIQGESTDSKHKTEIDVLSWSWGESNSGAMGHGGGGGAGKVSVQDFHFTMRVSKATPKLLLACASGKHIKSIDFVARKAGTEQQEYLKIKFSDVLISSYQMGGTGGADLEGTDSCSFNFSKVEYAYAPQKADGTLDGPITSWIDVKANTWG